MRQSTARECRTAIALFGVDRIRRLRECRTGVVARSVVTAVRLGPRSPGDRIAASGRARPSFHVPVFPPYDIATLSGMGRRTRSRSRRNVPAVNTRRRFRAGLAKAGFRSCTDRRPADRRWLTRWPDFRPHPVPPYTLTCRVCARRSKGSSEPQARVSDHRAGGLLTHAS